MNGFFLFFIPFLFGLFFASVVSLKKNSQTWFRGTFHIHTLWSDGYAFPETAIQYYKNAGYHFVCITDHNIFQDETLRFSPGDVSSQYLEKIYQLFENQTSFWRLLGSDSLLVQDTIKLFGPDILQSRQVGNRTFYRLKTFAELEKMFNDPGKFVLLPGFELSTGTPDGHMCHLNLINVHDDFSFLTDETIEQIILNNFEKAVSQYKNNKEPYLFVINHPIWRFYDISPLDILAYPQLRFFELNNNGLFLFSRIDVPYYYHPDAWTPEKFWDIVNTFRAVNNQPLLIAIGSDDRHSYAKEHLNTVLGPHAWSYVLAKDLSTKEIIKAVSRGDIYCSNGLEFKSIFFSPQTKTLSVEAIPIPGFDLRIEFFGTKRNFNSSYNTIQCPVPEQPLIRRNIDIFSDDIGMVLKTVHGSKGEYQLQDDDLFIRARVITLPVSYATKGKMNPFPAAWTQAYRATSTPDQN